MTPDDVRRDYRESMAIAGGLIALRRETLDPIPETQPLRARVMGFTAEELASGIDQGARKVILLAEDVEREIAAGRWPSPPAGAPGVLKNDTLLLRGATLNVQSIDDSTRRIGDTLIAYEIVALG